MGRGTESGVSPIGLEVFEGGSGLWDDLRLIPRLAGSTLDLVLASLTISLLSLALPLTLMQVYDRIIPTQGRSTLLWLVIGFIVALGMECALRLCRSTITNWMSARLEHLLGVEALGRLLEGRLGDFESVGVGVHMDRLNSIYTLRSFYSGPALQVLMELPFAMLFILVMFSLGGWGMAVVPAVAVGVFIAVATWCRRNYHQNRQSQMQTNDHRYNFIIETLHGIHTVKALTMEEQMLRRYERLQSATAKANLKVALFGAMPANLGTMFSQMVLFGVILIGGGAVIDGRLTLGGLAACSLLAGRVFQPFAAAASFWVRYSDIRLAKDRLRELARTRTETAVGAPPLPKEIEGGLTIEDVSFRYAEDAPYLLQDYSLAISPRSFVCVRSDDATASSALLSLLMGVLLPEKGRVLVDEADLAAHDHKDLRGRMEHLYQTGVLFQGTIFDNITRADPASFEAAKDAATLLGLDEAVAQLPQGYETMVGNRLYEFLPTGVVQRICVARALVVRPRVLLLDRVDASLDSESEKVILWLLARLKGGCTIVSVTDHPRILEMADEVVHLEAPGSLVQGAS